MWIVLAPPKKNKKKGKNSAAHLSYPTLVHSYSVCTGVKLSGSKSLIHLECLHFVVCVSLVVLAFYFLVFEQQNIL